MHEERTIPGAETPARAGQSRRTEPPRPNGFGLVSVLLVLLVMSALAGVAMQAATIEQKSSTALNAEGVARYAAEAGAHVVWSEWPSGAESLAPGDSLVLGWETLGNGARYRGVIHRYDDGSGQELRVLRVFGRGSGVRAGQHVMEVWSTTGPSSPFTMGVGAKDELEVRHGSEVDSYDSADGPYGLLNSGDQGHVASNGKLEVKDGSVVNGNASSHHDIDDSGGTITGSQTEGAPEQEWPAVDCPQTGYTPGGQLMGVDYDYDDGNGELEVEGVVILSGGTHYFNEIKLKDNARIVPAAGQEVIVYVEKEMRLASGAEVNSVTGDPTDFLMYGCGDEGADFRFMGDNDVYGAVFSPEFEIEFSEGSEFWGAYIGRKVKFSGEVKIHYDVQLAEVSAPGGAGGRTLLSRAWSQVNR